MYSTHRFQYLALPVRILSVNRVFTLLVARKENRRAYAALLDFAGLFTRAWDDPVMTREF